MALWYYIENLKLIECGNSCKAGTFATPANVKTPYNVLMIESRGLARQCLLTPLSSMSNSLANINENREVKIPLLYGVVNSSIKQLNICGSFHHEKIQAFETVASNFDALLRVKNGALNSERRRPGRARRACWNFIINAPGKALFMA